MPTRKPLVIVSGVTQQIADADALSANGGVERGSAGALALGTDANTTSVNLGTNAAVTGISIGTGMGLGDTILIGGVGAMTQIQGDLQVDGVQTFVGGSTFQQDATFEGNVTFGNATTDNVSFVSRIGPLATPNVNLVKEVDHIIGVDASTTAATDGGYLTVRAGSGNTSGNGGNAFYEAGNGGATGAGGGAYLQAGDGGGTSGAGGNTFVYGGDATSGVGGAVAAAGGNSAAGAGGQVTVSGGSGTGAAGGAVSIDGGTGTTKGAINIGGTNSGTITVGNVTDNPVIQLIGSGTKILSGNVQVGGTLRLAEQAGDPVAVGNTGFLYTKDVATVTELFYEASDGTVSQLTPGGGAGTLASVLAAGNTTGGTDIIFSSGDDVQLAGDGVNWQIAFSAAATAGNGGRAQLVGQDAAATFVGGVSQVVGGAGGASSGATPGAQGGSGRALGGAGGAGSVTAAGGLGGSASLIAGVGGNAAGAFADGAGGSVNIIAGASGTGGTGAVGGSVIIDAGLGSSGVNGAIELGTGTLSSAAAAQIRLGASVQWTAGAFRTFGVAQEAPETAGDGCSFFAGDGGDSAGANPGGVGGDLFVFGGSGGAGSGAQAPGAGGGVWLEAGAGGAGGTGNSAGGVLTLLGGQALGTGDGGDVVIEGGSTVSGSVGRVLIATQLYTNPGASEIIIGNATQNPPTTFVGTGTVSLTGTNQQLSLVGSGAGTGGGILSLFEAVDPSTVANTGALYTKDVAGATQLFYREASSGTVHQLTPAGASSSNAVIITGLTTAGVTTGHAVYVSAASTMTACDANGTAATARCFGFYEGTSGSVKVAGVVTPVFTTAPSVGDPIYLSLVAGEVTPTAPSGVGEFVAEVGIALTTTTMLIQVKTVIAL
jgi:hypothetical protein